MDKVIKNILKKIENEGYEAYIVGGFVRDKVLGKDSFDVDICTNALPKDLKNMFPLNSNANNYGGFNMKYKKYNIDITTYRKENTYAKRKPVSVTYINNLIDDMKRRDFTINSLCFDKNENLIDLLNAKEDLDNKIIKMIGDPNIKFNEDPLRMLRAIRFASILDFEIEKNTYKGICKNYDLTKDLSSTRIKEELSKILASTNYQKGLDLLNDTKISESLKINYTTIIYTTDILGMWAQISCPKIVFEKNEKESINKIKTILKRGTINAHDIFTYGLYITLVASDILKIKRSEINKIHKNMQIHSMKDIDITGPEIIDLLKIKPGKIISNIFCDLKNKLLNNEIKNKKSELKKYIMENYHEQG